MRLKLSSAAVVMAAAAMLHTQTVQAQPLQPNSTTNAVIDDEVEIDLPERKDRIPADSGEVQMDEAPNVKIINIDFVGDGVPEKVAEAAMSYIGRYATTENIRQLAADMDEAFVHSSVPIYTFTIPKQDLSDGVIKILVAEGYVGKVVLKGETEGAAAPHVRAVTNKIVGQRPLSREGYERALLLTQRIPGLDSKISLSQTDTPKAVGLVMELDSSRPTLDFGFSNRGPSFVDDGIATANANIYSMLQSGDHTKLSLSGSVTNDALRYGAISHDTPIGHDGMRLALSGALIRTNSGLLEGEAISIAAGISYPLLLTRRKRITASISIDRLDAKNAYLGSVIAAEKDWTARASLSGQFIEDKTAIGGRLTVAKGLDIFDAEISPLTGEADYTYVDGLAQLTQAVGDAVIFRLGAKARWTKDKLPAAERFSLGGAQYGRAFDDGALNGDRGYGAYGEVALRPIKNGAFRKSELYAFIDEGRTTLLERPIANKQSYSIGSWGAGARFAWDDKVKLGVEASKARHAPTAIADKGWQFAINWSVDFRP